MAKNDKPVQKTVKLSSIVVDDEFQARVSIDDSIVADYAEQMKLGANFPPVEVVEDAKTRKLYLTDGFHRVAAARLNGVALIGATITPGTRADGKWLAAGANKAHGLRRTNADKRKAGLAALMARPNLADTVIALHVGVSSGTISNYRNEMVAAGALRDEGVRIGLDGRRVDVDKMNDRKKAIAALAAKKAAKYTHCPTCRGTGMIKVLK